MAFLSAMLTGAALSFLHEPSLQEYLPSVDSVDSVDAMPDGGLGAGDTMELFKLPKDTVRWYISYI